MARLIDTDVFIQMERRGLGLGSISLALDESIAISSITASELLIGVHRANTPERAIKRSAFVEAVLSVVPVLPFDLAVARVHAAVAAELARQGCTVGAHDLIIAATALTHGFGVLTSNADDFGRIPGLDVERPAWAR